MWRHYANNNMKKIAKILTLFITLLIFSCKKEDVIPPCKLSIIDRGNGNKHTYTYDTNGRISQMDREFDGSGSGDISKYVYTFTYDNAGLLVKSNYKLDGKAEGSETYSYTNGKISKVTFIGTDGTKGINNIKYDAAGRILEFTFETGDPNADGKQYFEYDANGITTKRGFADLSGNKYFEVATKPVGMAKSPEALLANNGLPFDVLTGFSWQAASGNVGTESEVFYADNDGKLVSDGKDKITDVKVNAQGYIIESTSTDAANKANIQKFTLLDCN
jgi:antitoxin component YwqK of YwqJK toxin-antitoxin module